MTYIFCCERGVFCRECIVISSLKSFEIAQIPTIVVFEM